MINWFEWNKNEVEVKAVVDWRSAGTPAITKAYTAELPDWFHLPTTLRAALQGTNPPAPRCGQGPAGRAAGKVW